MFIRALLLAHHGNLFNHVLEGNFGELFETPLDWLIFAAMLGFIAAGVLLVRRYVAGRRTPR